MPRHNSARITCSKEELQALDPYVARVVLARREYELSTKAMAQTARRSIKTREFAAARTASDAFFHLWIGLVWVAADAWQSRLRCRDARIEALLESEFTPLLREFRHVVFHFEPDFRIAPLQFAGEEDEVLVWLDDLTEALAAFIVRELGANCLVGSVVTTMRRDT